MKLWPILAFTVFSAAAARADVTLLLEEPYGAFGSVNPTGHAAIYLSRVCAATPLSLRLCEPGEQGVVLSRYHRVGGFDWIAIPLIPYLYAVDYPEQVPDSITVADAAALRDAYRRAHLESVAPDAPDGSMPVGDWTQLVGEAYDRTIYTFSVETSEQQDQALITAFNSSENSTRFNLLFSNCADFARKTINFYYPHAIHRNFGGDMAIMTPKQAARSLVAFGKRHPGVNLISFVIPQVPGDVPRSGPVRGVLESLVKSKKYAVLLVPVAALHPVFGLGMAYAWVKGSLFDPKHVQAHEMELQPAAIAGELQSRDGAWAEGGE